MMRVICRKRQLQLVDTIIVPTSGSCLLLIGVLRQTVLYKETPRIYELVYAYIYIALVIVD